MCQSLLLVHAVIHTLWVLDVKAVLCKHSYVIIEVWSILCMNSSTAYSLPNVRFTPSTFAMTGQSYSLTCTVQVFQCPTAIPNVTWLAPDGSSLQNGSGTTVGQEGRNGNITTLHLTIDRLNQSLTGNYTCQACISIDKAAIEGHCGHVMAEVTLSGKWYYPLTMYTVEFCSFLL